MYTKRLYTKCIPTLDKLLYAFGIQNVAIENVYKMFVYRIYPTFRQTFVYKMYTKCGYTECIPNFNQFLYTFCI